jgi:hypothetical protein
MFSQRVAQMIRWWGVLIPLRKGALASLEKMVRAAEAIELPSSLPTTVVPDTRRDVMSFQKKKRCDAGPADTHQPKSSKAQV